MPFAWIGASLLIGSSLTDLIPVWLGLVAFVTAMAFYFRIGSPPSRKPIEVTPPVIGHWRAINSPADQVPSHGLHAYGQTYAIDLVRDPEDGERPAIGWWPLARRPEEFPAFGAEVRSPIAGTDFRSPCVYGC